MTDITKEAVERLARSLAFVANRTGMTVEKCEEITDDAAATLRAISDRLAEVEAERDRQYDENVNRIAQQAAAEARAEAAEAELAVARAALTYTVRADNLREAYHALPNERAPIGGKRSRKGHARDAWLRAFRKAAKNARKALASLDEDTPTPAPEVSVGEAKEHAIDTIEEIIGETHDLYVTDRRYAENIVAWLERHHPAALRALDGLWVFLVAYRRHRP